MQLLNYSFTKKKKNTCGASVVTPKTKSAGKSDLVTSMVDDSAGKEAMTHKITKVVNTNVRDPIVDGCG